MTILQNLTVIITLALPTAKAHAWCIEPSEPYFSSPSFWNTEPTEPYDYESLMGDLEQANNSLGYYIDEVNYFASEYARFLQCMAEEAKQSMENAGYVFR